MPDVRQFAARSVTAAAPAAGAVDAGTPGKQTTIAGAGAATAAAPPVARVIADQGKYVRDAHGFTYEIRGDGAFVVFNTPQQLTASRGMAITPDGRYAARWREVASLVMSGAATALELAAEPPPDSTAAWFRTHYRQAAAGRPLAQRLATYATCVAARPVIQQQAYAALGGDAAAIKRGFDEFADALEADLAVELAGTPDAARLWRAFAEGHAEAIAQQPRLSAFRHRVVTTLIDGIAAGAPAPAGEGVRALVDTHLRGIVDSHCSHFFAAASNGVHRWHLPADDPDAVQNALSVSSTLTGGIGGIVTEFVSTGLLKAAGIGLQGIGIGLGLAQTYLAYRAAEEATRLQVAQDGIRDEVLHGIEAVSDAIRQQQDVIAALIAAAAFKRGVDTKSADLSALRAFAWKEMFGALPEDSTALRATVTATIKKHLDPFLKK